MYPAGMTRRALLAVALLLLPSCKDSGKASEARAVQWVATVAALGEKDVKDLEVGLPAGATRLLPLFQNGSDPSNDMDGVRKGLRKIRAEVPELTRSASTFFALANPEGIAIRNDLEQDVMAGQDVWKLFPELKKTTTQPFVVASGLFSGARAPGEPDRDWVAAVPLKDMQGRYGGMLMGGWTMRRFAYHLQESLRHDLTEDQAKTKDPGKLPIVYVAVFDPSGVYCAPVTPAVNQKALIDLGLAAKTAGGPAHGVITITERDFGWAATRMPSVGPDSGAVVLWSEI
jgi:hypothetical protein